MVKIYILTAKHIFKDAGELTDYQFGFVLNEETGIGVWKILKIVGSADYNIAFCFVAYAGIMVANQETHLLPAQIVKIRYGNNYRGNKILLTDGKSD